MCMKPHQGIWYFAFLFILPLKAFCRVIGRYEIWASYITYFAKSKTGLQGEASHTLWSRASVWNFYNVLILKYFCTPLNHESLSFWMNAFYLKVWAIFIYFFLFFSSCSLACIFSLMPFGMDIFLFLFLFPFFSIAHTVVLAYERETHDKRME